MTVEGQGQERSKVGAGACEMMTTGGRWCSLSALAVRILEGEPLTVTPVCES